MPLHLTAGPVVSGDLLRWQCRLLGQVAHRGLRHLAEMRWESALQLEELQQGDEAQARRPRTWRGFVIMVHLEGRTSTGRAWRRPELRGALVLTLEQLRAAADPERARLPPGLAARLTGLVGRPTPSQPGFTDEVGAGRT